VTRAREVCSTSYFPATSVEAGASSAFKNNSTSSGWDADNSSKRDAVDDRFSNKTVRTVGVLMTTDAKSRKFDPDGVRIRYRCE
jgi:hypothetical protein